MPGTRIFVFFPHEGVSAVQRAQMVTQEGANVTVCAVRGNFDDCQRGVKQAFAALADDAALAARHQALTSANSINIGRLAPQLGYYFIAYARLLREGRISLGDPVDYVVPTGNFGDILAGWMAKQLGLPVGRLICASNANRVLTDFFESGVYDRRRDFFRTASPSMDILVSSNLERLLYYVSGGDCALVRSCMEQLSKQGFYRFPEELMAKLEKELEENETEYEAVIAAELAASDAIDAKIAQLYAAYLASHGVSAGEGSISVDNSGGQTVITYTGASGTLMWPVPGCYNVSSDYGTRTHPITGEVSRMHYGMDIDGYGHDGGDIVACDGGVVTTVGYNSGYGNYIIVDHGNGMQTLYAHMSGTAVTEGTTVGQGETIGYLGATGMATGTHCHVEVFVDGENVDPAAYLG